ncbi:hypothetical protein [Azospirillum sp. sgz302134]
MNTRICCAALALGLVATPALAGSSSAPSWRTVELPPVGREVVAEATGKSAAGNANIDDLLQPVSLSVSPGVNELVYVARDNLNRIVTPFSHPEVKGPEGMTVDVHDNVVYIAPGGKAPVSVYITEKGEETVAINLTLVPEEIPTREIRLMPKGGRMPIAAGSAVKAQQWEQSHPYIDTVRLVMRDIALERIPQGYNLRRTDSSDRVPVCQPPTGVQVSFADGQTMGGANLEVRIGTVTNRSGGAVELLETWCAQDLGVAAVSFWPHVVLAAGQTSEIYVALRRGGSERSSASIRPSLLGGSR